MNKSPPMITSKNYHIATKGTFNVVSTAKIKRLWHALQKQGFDLQETAHGTAFKMTPSELLDQLASAQAENRAELAEANTELAAVEAAFEENEN